MGMFDSFKPKDDYSCPVCGEELEIWQSKDLDCLLFEWTEGVSFPTGTGASPDCVGPEYFKATISQTEFMIYSFDCECPYPTFLKCKTKSGVWQSTSLFTGSEADVKFIGGETNAQYKKRMQWLNNKL